jgi:hypothetical protein
VKYPFTAFLIIITTLFVQAQKNNKSFSKILNKNEKLNQVLSQSDKYKIQILFTPVENGKPMKTFSYNVSDKSYFYPASTVKLPAALLSLEKLNKMDSINKDTPMSVISNLENYPSVFYDSTSANFLPSIGHYIKKIFLVSDNEAYNRLYDFLGQTYFNNSMHQKGYKNFKISHRLSITLSPEVNSSKPAVGFGNIKTKQPLPSFAQKERMDMAATKFQYFEPAEIVKEVAQPSKKAVYIGNGYMLGDTLIDTPMDFSSKNKFGLRDQHELIKSLFFPNSVTANKRFNLSSAQLSFVKKYMSMTPRESDYPRYDPNEYFDSYVKFFIYGDQKDRIPEHVKIYNKVGQAYGFLIDNAYIEDSKNDVSFILSAIIYCNEDGVLNDDKYEYDEVGFPFLAELGRVIYKHQLLQK